MAGYIGTKAVSLSTTGADIAGDAGVSGALDVGGAFTSQGIDDNATSTAMTLDGSGNLFVSKTSSDTNAVGVELGAAGYGAFCRDSNKVAIFNRKNSDGVILDIQKDGSRVGVIGTAGGAAYLSGPSRGLMFANNVTYPVTNTGATADNAYDLGGPSGRFKDLYLSGGVYLGGTGSANTLDDYEEGTWTPSYPSGWTGEAQYANYTKVGRFCYYNAKILVNNTSSGNFSVGGLPFTNGAYAKTHGAQMFEQVTLSTNRTQVVAFTSGNSNSHEFYQLHSAGGSWYGLSSSNINSNSEFYIQGVIVTA